MGYMWKAFGGNIHELNYFVPTVLPQVLIAIMFIVGLVSIQILYLVECISALNCMGSCVSAAYQSEHNIIGNSITFIQQLMVFFEVKRGKKSFPTIGEGKYP